MSDGIDRLAQAHAAGGVSRRKALRVLLGASASTLVGGALGERLLRSPGGRQLVRTAGRTSSANSAGVTATRAGGAAGSPTNAAKATAAGASSTCPLPNQRRPLNGPDDCPSGRIPKENYTPTFNGCGSAGVGGYLVPDDFDGYSFTPACNNHDKCYGTCNSVKSTCDSNFLNDMDRICDLAFLDFSPAKHDCRENAWIYYSAVADTLVPGVHVGQSAYDDAQVEACDCCEEFIECAYCPCNDKYYGSAVDCTNDCHVSLGCFINICGPADAQDCLQAWRQ